MSGDHTGTKGEHFAVFHLMGGKEIFDVHLIGGKWPTIDIYAEVKSRTGMYCFFQVKSTKTKFDKKVKISVSKKKLNMLAKYNAPTYLLGVEIDKGGLKSAVYFKSIKGNYSSGLSKLDKLYEVTPKNLIILRDEIIDFWEKSNTLTIKSKHKTNFSI